MLLKGKRRAACHDALFSESIGPSAVIHMPLRLIACDRCYILMPNLATRLVLLIVRLLRLSPSLCLTVENLKWLGS
jgi:hypothetical protein